MIEIKFLGRGGQGVVVASEMLARACFEEGLYPQSFSIFGGERRGAAVGAFVRVDHEKIYLKCDIDRPDHLILFDGTLLKEEEVIEQIKDGGVLLLNRERKIPANGLQGYTIGTINAFEISKRHGLGAIMNTAILGAYVRLTGMVRLQTLLEVIRQNVPAAGEKNVMAAMEAYESVRIS